jgi:hypothetical protein
VTLASPVPEPFAERVAAPVIPAAAERGIARRAVRMLGALNVIVLSAYALVSYGMSLVAPFGAEEPLEARALLRLANAADPGGSAARALLGVEAALAEPIRFVMAYGFFLLVPSLVFILLLVLVARHRHELDAALVRQLFRWAVAFAVIAALSHPVLVQDFWLSAGWGRLVAEGVNPYYVHLDARVTDGLPLDYLELLMTYGPLWALVSGGVMAVAGSNTLLAGILFKLIIVGAWIGTLALVARLLRSRPIVEQCVGMAIVGWLPLGIVQIAAAGHNDSFMVVFVVLWLYGLERGRDRLATVSLAASVLVKYLSAPLFLLDLAHALRSRGRRWTAYVPHAAIAAAMALVVFGIFVRSPAFFDSTVHMAGWHFFTPRDGVVTTGRLFGIEPGLGSLLGILVAGVAVAVQLAFVLLIPFGIMRYWRAPSSESFRYAVLTTTIGMLFGVAGHLWPWFLVWGLVIVALHPRSAFARFTTGVALVIPFALLHWIAFSGPEQLTYVTPPMYLFVVLWFFLAPRRWFGASDATA